MTRRISKPLRIGKVTIGGDVPIVVQSMTKTDTRDIPATINQIAAVKLFEWQSRTRKRLKA